jgi:crotonobetainyl-CoA:carnitine CoA-transferase CaiB-like acyl-CoA transferase
MCRAVGLEEVAADPRLKDTATRMQNMEHLTHTLQEVIGPAAARLTSEEFDRRLTAEDVPHGLVRRLRDVHTDPQVVSNGTFVEHEHPIAGRMREPRHAALFRGTPIGDPAPAPGLGQHSAEILEELGFAERRAELRDAGVVA